MQSETSAATASLAPKLPVGEATYVDDEFLAIANHKPKQLAADIPKLLKCVLLTFKKHGSRSISRKARPSASSSSEALSLPKWYDKLFVSSSPPAIALPAEFSTATSSALHVVDESKHVGVVVNVNGN